MIREAVWRSPRLLVWIPLLSTGMFLAGWFSHLSHYWSGTRTVLFAIAIGATYTFFVVTPLLIVDQIIQIQRPFWPPPEDESKPFDQEVE